MLLDYFIGNPARCPKFFNVLSLLSKWQEFSNDDAAKACKGNANRNGIESIRS
jgi:hypothetical protein